MLVSYPDPNVEQKMSDLAKKEKRFDVMWGVVNPGNALCAGIFRTKHEAMKCRREKAYAYVVVRVAITPLYAKDGEK